MPISEGPHRDALSQWRVDHRSAPALFSGVPNPRQQPIHGGGTHGQQAFSYRGIQLQMPMAFHCIDQPGDHLTEPFATNSIGRLPNDRQRFLNGFVVDPRPLSRFRGFPPGYFLQHADRVLAMKPVTLTNSSRISFFWFRPAARYRAAISSRLVVTLNCLLNLAPAPFIGTGNIFHEATGRAG